MCKTLVPSLKHIRIHMLAETGEYQNVCRAAETAESYNKLCQCSGTIAQPCVKRTKLPVTYLISIICT
jgi:hypothetical protein